MKPVPLACLPYIYATPCAARVYTEAIVTDLEDVRNRASEVASASLTNVEGYDDGSLRLTGSGVSQISKATGTDFYATLTNMSTANYDVVAWNLAETIGSPAVLRSISVRCSRRRVAGNPAFDGWFVLTVYRLRAGSVNGTDTWGLQPVADSLPTYAASMASDEENVSFAFATTGTGDRAPPAINLDGAFDTGPLVGHDGRITPPVLVFPGRTVVIGIEAKGGSATTTNYAVIRDNAVTTVTATGGTLMVKTMEGRVPPTNQLPDKLQAAIVTGSGLWRCAFTTASYPATGVATYSDAQKINFGAVPAGDIEVVARTSVPPGTSLVTYVSASLTAVANWTAVTDGQILSALSTAIATASMYAMKAEFAAATTLDVTPVLWELGLRSRITTDLTEYCTVGPAGESVNPLTGEVLLAECEVSVLRHGDRDFQGIERLLSETDFSSIELRTYIGHDDLARGDWLYLDTWRVDDYEVRQSDVRLTAVSVLERLKGRFPTAVSGPVGWVVSNTTSTLVGGSFNKLFATASGTAAIVTVTTSATATSTMGFVFSPAGMPGLAKWPFGSWSVQVNVTGTASNAAVAVLLSRVNSAGTVQQSAPQTEFQSCQATGVKTFTIANMPWTAGAAADRVRVAVVVTNVSATSAVSVQFGIGTINSQTVAPWLPVVERAPVSVDATTPQAAWNTWISTVGLSERYKGNPPPNVTDLIGKEILDADGKRELERIAFVAGGMPIASQGRVTWAGLMLPNGTARVVFPFESYTPVAVSPGFRSRIPTLYVPYGYDGGKFRGEVKVVHDAALSTYGVSRIDNPDTRVEDETAKYFRDMTLAGIVGQDLVLAGGAGMMTATIRPSFRHPELELGDTVAIEIDLFALKDPVTDDAIRGYVWAIGRIIGRTGPWNDELTVWIRGVSDLHHLGATAEKRTPYDAPIAEITVEPDPDNPERAKVRIGTQISGASIYYQVMADGTVYPPNTEDPSWLTYSGVITVARHPTADRLVAAFATANGILGPVFQARIAPSVVAAAGFIGTLAGTESGTTITVVASDPSVSVRKIRWYMRQHATAFPTADSSATGVLDEAYFVAMNEVAADLGGSLAQAHTAVVYSVAASVINVIAVPVDFNGKPGARKTLSYHWLGTLTPNLTAATWAVNVSTAGAARTIDFAWTPNASVADVTHDLAIYLQPLNGPRATMTTVADPVATVTVSNISTSVIMGTGEPQETLYYTWELLAGATVIASGTFSPAFGDTFDRGDGNAF